MSIKCTQCDKEAIGAVNNGQGPAFCLEHMYMFQNMISKNISDLRNQEDSILDFVEMTTGVKLRPPKPAPVLHQGNYTVNNLKIDRSHIGVLNTGTINQLDSSITFIERNGNQDLADQLTKLSENIISTTAFDLKLKNEIFEQLAFLGDQIKKDKSTRNLSVIKTILNSVSSTLSSSADIATIWSVTQTLLKSAFGL